MGRAAVGGRMRRVLADRPPAKAEQGWRQGRKGGGTG